MSVTRVELGGPSESEPVSVRFTLDYYGFHDPTSKNIHLIATAGPVGYPSNAYRGRTNLGGRLVALSTNFVPGYFGGNTTSTAVWVERGISISVTMQGISQAQAARFVAGLKEHPLSMGA